MPPETVPAATLVLFRPGSGADEHLFVERAASMRFAGGATVFPGGRVDPADQLLASRYPCVDPEDAAARIAAIRETLEESGVLVGVQDAIDQPTIAAMRAALHGGSTLLDLLADHGLTLALDQLTPFARWCPNLHETRNFDTRFYVARLPGDAGEASADAGETVHLFWATAQHVLDRADAGDLSIIFPTRRNLERLAALGTYDAAQDQAQVIPAERITPWIDHVDGQRYLNIPNNLGYPVTREAMNSVRRG